jgi:hypothetical protein
MLPRSFSFFFIIEVALKKLIFIIDFTFIFI